MSIKNQLRLSLTASAILLLHSELLFAQIRPFFVDPGQSSITLSGHVLGFALQEQGTNSLRTSYGGLLRVEAEGEGNFLRFVGGELVDAQTNGSWRPLAGGAAGVAPADYGAKAISGSTTAHGAVRNFRLDAISQSLGLEDGTFDAAGITFVPPLVDPAMFDCRVVNVITLGGQPVEFLLFQGSLALTNMVPNQSNMRGFLQTNGLVETLTIPVQGSTPLSLVSPGDGLLVIQGRLVANRTNPPPLVITSVSILPDQWVHLTWTSIPGRTYRVESSQIELGSWFNVSGDLLAADSSLSWSNPVASSVEFFRVATDSVASSPRRR